jgi:hypothetical protein
MDCRFVHAGNDGLILAALRVVWGNCEPLFVDLLQLLSGRVERNVTSKGEMSQVQRNCGKRSGKTFEETSGKAKRFSV